METPISIKYLGHATALITIASRHLLTDPNFSVQVGITSRKIKLAMEPQSLPDLDAVLISHGSPDHLNIDSFKYIPTHVPVVVPNKLGNYLSSLIPNPIIELKSWASHHVQHISITSVPSHRSINRLWKILGRHHATGFLITHQDLYIYYAGSATPGTHFSEIGSLYPVTAALLPMGQPLTRCVRSCGGLTINESIEAVRALKCRWMIPLNLSTFSLNPLRLFQPDQLMKEAASQKIDNRILIIPEGKERAIQT